MTGIFESFKVAYPDSYAYLLKMAREENVAKFTLSFVVHMANQMKPHDLLKYAGEITYSLLRAHDRIAELEAQLEARSPK